MANHSSLLPHFSHWLFPVRPSIMINKTGVRSIRVFSMSMISSWSLAPSMNSSRVSSPAGSEVRIHNYIIKCLLNTAQTKMLKSCPSIIYWEVVLGAGRIFRCCLLIIWFIVGCHATLVQIWQRGVTEFTI